jgi:hypothetical protein
MLLFDPVDTVLTADMGTAFSGAILASELNGFSGGGGGINVVVVWPRTERVSLPDTGVFVAPTDSVTVTIEIDTVASALDEYSPTRAQVTVFPNPVQHQVAVLATEPIEYLQLLDAQGRVVLTEYQRAVLNLELLAAGAYSLRVQLRDGSTAVYRLVRTP